MKVGIAFGCYCPLHQGHLDTIMRAKKENDNCVVFVCGYDNDRGEDILPLIKRYRIISNFLTDGITKVSKINDDDLGLDQSMSDYNWRTWLTELYRQLAEMGYSNSDEFNFYVAEAAYCTPISKYIPNGFNVTCHLLDRSINPVSGTLCRKYPLKYWHYITAPFRAYYSHNILIAGTASEGKTTLTQDLGRYFGLLYSYEKGRDNCQIKTDPEFTVKDFVYNIYEQHKYNEELICSPRNSGVFISDTDNIVTLMYAYFYSKRDNFVLNEEEYKLLYSLAEMYMQTTKWDKIFLMPPKPKAIVDDGERYMPDSDYEIRVEFYEILKKLYHDFGYEFEELNGNYYENFCRVKNYINGLYERG